MKRWIRRAVAALPRALPDRVGRIARLAGDAGMSTAEYAVGLVAACAFAALLYKILTSSEMESLLRGLISKALHVSF